MKKFFIISALLVAAIGFSQNQGAIKGNILDLEMQNEPLLFADVQLKGSDAKTQTNFHGNFEFENITAGEYELIVTYAGYETIKMPVLVENDKITQLNYGMHAKKVNLNAVLSANASTQVTSNTSL